MTEHFDVVIVGAGLSGVGAASHLRHECPEKSVVILESRSAIGGTWDLFRYPGVRSDSDMFTLGYSFRPWTDPKAIADGASIREYINATVVAEGLSSQIRLNHRVIGAQWSSETARWTVTAATTTDGEYAMDAPPPGETIVFTCSFLSVCSGYYRYDEGFAPTLPGADTFRGRIVHPQQWPADLDYDGKRVVIIGSGATAVTLVPSMATTAAQVTMLQRSPTYIAPVASSDKTADRLRRVLPAKLAYGLIRAKNIGFSMAIYQLSRRRPSTMKALLRKAAVSRLPEDFDYEKHLTPTYNPWDQRLCAIPDADLFRTISDGSANIVTDTISTLTPTGIELASGATLDADVIVSATGLNILAIGGITLVVDGQPVELAKTLAYKGMMLAGVPNFSLTIGYTNASWTLKADLVAQYVCRLLRHMSAGGYDTVVPVPPASALDGTQVSLIDLDAGYIRRGASQLPRQGAKTPWRLRQDYLRDFRLLRLGRVTDDVSFEHRRLDSPLSRSGAAVATIGGRQLRYRVTGEGTPVLLLHGIGRSLEDWDEQHDLLSPRHRVISIDMPGFAYSDRGAATMALADLAGGLDSFLDSIGVTGALPVIGNSLGGAVAMTFAVAHPERVSQLVLVDSAGFGRDVTIALRLVADKAVGVLLARPNRMASARSVRSIFHDGAFATADRIERSYTLALRPGHMQTVLDIARELGSIRGVRPQWRESLIESLRALAIPTLVLWGDRDRVLPFSHFDAALAELPGSEGHVFPKTGHMPQIERSEEFAAVVGQFLARTTAIGHETDNRF
jgi:cation diffusion facilitator CzcD-associated flavoprotein CzcO/pimeloyl-ACP methyl ester carboxylesterase